MEAASSCPGIRHRTSSPSLDPPANLPPSEWIRKREQLRAPKYLQAGEHFPASEIQSFVSGPSDRRLPPSYCAARKIRANSAPPKLEYLRDVRAKAESKYRELSTGNTNPGGNFPSPFPG